MTNILVNAEEVPLVANDDVLVPDGKDYGDFYYLGFNDLFDNWYVKSKGTSDPPIVTKPASPKFRVGLQHGDSKVKPGDADFAHYRITIEDSNGDLLGYHAKTVDAIDIYGSNVITFGVGDARASTGAGDATDNTSVTTLAPMSNVRLSNQVAAVHWILIMIRHGLIRLSQQVLGGWLMGI